MKRQNFHNKNVDTHYLKLRGKHLHEYEFKNHFKNHIQWMSH